MANIDKVVMPSRRFVRSASSPLMVAVGVRLPSPVRKRDISSMKT